MKYPQWIVVSLIVLGRLTSGCGPGGTGAGNPMIVQSAPLTGPNAAFMRSNPFNFFEKLLLVKPAYASVSAFTEFKACNDTMVFIDNQGNPVSLNGASNLSVGAGLLTFDPSNQNPMTIGSVAVPAGTVLSEIRVTFAAVPDICQGANYAVEFNDGPDGIKDITQNTAFKFKFSGNGSMVGQNAKVTLMFGQIVNGMVSLGANLNNATIQTVNVGQAQ